ncbi:hypothetical protein [Thiothrix lacustris]|uniref:AlgX/AlgJ SGNH hydrolase-like domain-containing protein n=1 Tax=Thiothrix lacustris TaxID=525917 RepID=A0ABY9MLY3_9GAMM|nr:hypothetical protein [Thiothrix lacustris]WML89562.1 hypothetical protein RCF98_11330 [Thiothrix lacustris]WMP18889.1 hypothetical protein RCS87_07445 [Thiothrix lacustris]
MPLSISSSNANERLPTGNWLLTWVITLVLTLSTIFGWEWYCRTIGFTPNGVADTDDLWVQARKRASSVGHEGVILVGASRIQLGVNTDVMSRYTQTRPVQLALDGSQFMPILENLAADDSITGTVIVDMEIEKISRPNTDERTTKLLDYYRYRQQEAPYGAIQPLENWLTTHLNSLFAFRLTGANPQMLLSQQLAGVNLAGDYLITLPDRSRQADYTKVSQPDFYLTRLQRNLGNETLDNIKPSQWPAFEADVHVVEGLVQRIEKRGGRVIFVRFPTDKGIWQIDEGRLPRVQYWDKLAALTSAETIHFKDYPELSRFDQADGSHLDYRDAIPFTEALSRIIFKQPTPAVGSS